MNKSNRPTPFYGIFQLLGITGSDEVQLRPFYIAETYNTIEGLRTRFVRGGFASKTEAERWVEQNKPKPALDLQSALLRRVIWFIDTLDNGQSPEYKLVQEALNDVIAGRLALPEMRIKGR